MVNSVPSILDSAWVLCYRGSLHGFSQTYFHYYCDYRGMVHLVQRYVVFFIHIVLLHILRPHYDHYQEHCWSHLGRLCGHTLARLLVCLCDCTSVTHPSPFFCFAVVRATRHPQLLGFGVSTPLVAQLIAPLSRALETVRIHGIALASELISPILAQRSTITRRTAQPLVSSIAKFEFILLLIPMHFEQVVAMT